MSLMKFSTMASATMVLAVLGLQLPADAQSLPTRVTATAAAAAKKTDIAAKERINAWTVGLAGGFIEGAPLRLAAEIARVVNEQDKLHVIASFSILGDLVKNVGGERLQVGTLVGPNGNAHVYAPSPGDAKSVADAKLVFVNGLGFEGWIDRLVKASGTKAPIIVATKGIKPRERAGAGGHDHDHGPADPHAWQSVANAKVYVANIRDALIAADPAGKDVYAANAAAYLAKLEMISKRRLWIVASPGSSEQNHSSAAGKSEAPEVAECSLLQA